MRKRLPKLSTIAEIRHEMNFIYRQMINGKITTKDSYAYYNALAMMLNASRTEDLEKRLAAMEEKYANTEAE